MHKMEDIWNLKMDKLKYKLAEDKKIFKSFMKLKDNELNIGENDD